MTRRSIKVGIRGEESRTRAEARTLLEYDAARPPESGPTEESRGPYGLKSAFVGQGPLAHTIIFFISSFFTFWPLSLSLFL